MKKQIAVAVVAAGLAFGLSTGVAQADPQNGPTTTTKAPAPGDTRRAICNALGIPNIDRGPFGNPCPPGL
jgi:hypothetical protein